MTSKLSVFFFQAEDGIRDGHVTGVQTCALPILAEMQRKAHFGDLDAAEFEPAHRMPLADRGIAVAAEIGRASCRERVDISEVLESTNTYKQVIIIHTCTIMQDTTIHVVNIGAVT